MDPVGFNPAGNEVTLIKRRNGEPAFRRSRDQVEPPGRSGRDRPPEFRRSRRLHRSRPSGTSRKRHRRIREPVRPGPRNPAAMAAVPILPAGLYKQLLDQLHDAVCFVDTERRILLLERGRGTPYRLFESTRSSGGYASTGCWTTWTRRVAASATEDCPWSAMDGGASGPDERLFLRHKDGRRIWVEVRVMPVRDRERGHQGRCRDLLRRHPTAGRGECLPPDQRGGRPRPAHRAGQPPLPRPDARRYLAGSSG